MKKLRLLVMTGLLLTIAVGSITVVSAKTKQKSINPLGCTSITLSTEDGTHLSGRTMDFSDLYGSKAVAINSKTDWKYRFNSDETFQSQYKIAGIGNVDEKTKLLMLGDAINEEGLMGISLYFSGYAQYAQAPSDGKKAINPAIVLSYILSNCKNLDEVKTEFEKNITLIQEVNPILNSETPLHFMFSDKSGKALIIEPDKAGDVTMYEDNVGVLTNGPTYSWHETNLRNYISVSPNQYASIEMEGKELSPFSQGSGSFGMPGDYTPPSRFIRASYQKKYTTKGATEIDGVTQLFHILATANIPKGMVIEDREDTRANVASNKGEVEYDHTVYTSAMSAETGRYYFFTYDNQQVNCIDLREQDFSKNNIQAFDIQGVKQVVNQLGNETK
jgi:Penicillin V acylase and related amidases